MNGVSDLTMDDIRMRIKDFEKAGIDGDVIWFVEQMAAEIGQLRHDYNICHSDAVANARYASKLERRLDAIEGVLPEHVWEGTD